MRRFFLAIMLLVILFTGTWVASAEAATSTSTQDLNGNCVESAYPTTAYYDTSSYYTGIFYVGGYGASPYVLLDAPIIPTGCVLTGGTMNEYACYIFGASFYDITSSWSSSVTWNTQPSIASTSYGSISNSLTTMDLESTDISPAIRYWNINSNHGLAEKNGSDEYTGEINIAYYSGEPIYIVLDYYNEPGALTLSAIGQTSVTCTWTANGNDNTPTYDLYRNGTLVYSGTSLTYTDTGVSPGTSYTYTVKTAYTATSGSDSGTTYYSAAQTASTTTPIVPAPGAFTTPTYGQTTITLNWGTNGLSGTFYVLTRNGTQVYSGSNLTYTDTGLATGTTYNYSVETGITGGAGTFYSTAQTASYETLPGNPTVTGACGLQEWSSTGGTGYVTLSWPAVTGATGYHLYVWDGYAYRQFNLGNVLSWDSRVALIYPSASALTQEGNVTSDLFNTTQTGLNLRDNPESLYRTLDETLYINTTNYFFWIAPYDASGENSTQGTSPSNDVAGAGYTPTLPTATDTTPPTVGTPSVLSASGLTTTYTTSVNLTLPTATDSQSGIYTVSVSNNGTTYTNEYTANIGTNGGTGVTSYAGTTIPWTVTVGAGTKTIYVEVTDAVGNSTVTTCAIAYVQDATAPTVTMQINSGATSTTSPTVTLTQVSILDKQKACHA